MKNLLEITVRMFAVVFIFIGSVQLHAQNWEPTNGPLGGSAKAITINSAGDIFISSRSGIFRSTNNGDNWEKTSNGLTFTSVSSFLVNTAGVNPPKGPLVGSQVLG